MIPHRSNTLDTRIKRIEPRQPKSFRNIIEETWERLAAQLNGNTDPMVQDLDEIAREAVESSNHQRHGANRFQGE